MTGETDVHTTLSRNVGGMTNNPVVEHEFVMTMVKMIRCYGQLDGVLALIRADGDIESTVTDIAAEISRLTKQMNNLRDRV